jgi:RecJ-like exonuclease
MNEVLYLMQSVVLTHGDVDGITAGAIALLVSPGATFYFTRPSQIHMDLFRIAKDRPDKVSISDIAVNRKRFPEVIRALDRFPSDTEITWVDHHPILSKHRKELEKRVDFFHEKGPSAAELVYKKHQDKLPEHAIHLALYGAIGDFCDDTAFAREHLEDYDKRTLYLEAGLLVQALQEIDYRRESKDLVRELTLGVPPSSMSNIVELAMKATRIEHEIFNYVKQNARKMSEVGYILDMPISGYRGKSAKFAAYVTQSRVGISARSFADVIDMSLRRRGPRVDLNKTLIEILSKIDNAHGGGHPAASGATMKKEDFPRFLQKLTEYVSKRT